MKKLVLMGFLLMILSIPSMLHTAEAVAPTTFEQFAQLPLDLQNHIAALLMRADSPREGVQQLKNFLQAHWELQNLWNNSGFITFIVHTLMTNFKKEIPNVFAAVIALEKRPEGYNWLIDKLARDPVLRNEAIIFLWNIVLRLIAYHGKPDQREGRFSDVDMSTQLLLHSILSSGIITPDDLVDVYYNPTFTALKGAIQSLNPELTHYLLEMGASPYNTNGTPPLFALYAAVMLAPASSLPARRKIFNLLMQYPVNPNLLYKNHTIFQVINEQRNLWTQYPIGSEADIQLIFDELDYEEAMIRENIRQQNLQSIQELRPNEEPLF